MNWFTPIDRPQLLPKDLLNYARKVPKDEAEKQIRDAVKKSSLYSHYNQTNVTLGLTSSASWPTQPTGITFSTTSWPAYSNSGTTLNYVTSWNHT